MIKCFTCFFVSLLTAFYSAFPLFPLPDCLRKYFPAGEGTEIYMLAPDPDSLMESFVIRTADNKIIVIDGGISEKSGEPYLPAAIRAILGVGKNGYFEVEAWFLSHAHNDHFYELAKMLNRYTASSNYRINNFYFDFPDIGAEWSSQADGDEELEDMRYLKEGFANYFAVNGIETDDAYGSVNGKVINAESVGNGLTVTAGGIDFDVLRTWTPEDRVVNSTSVVLRMRYGSHSVLFLGDSYTDTGDGLLAAYSPAELRSEYVQLAHHGQNGVSKEFYDAIGAKDSVRLWASPQWLWKAGADSQYQIAAVRTWMGLPAEENDFVSGGFGETGKDIIAGMYPYYPKRPEKTSAWTKAVLDAQRAAVFG